MLAATRRFLAKAALFCLGTTTVSAGQLAETALPRADDRVIIAAFANVTGADEDAWVGAGIAETLVAELSGQHRLAVVGPVLEGASGSQGVVEAGRRLGAEWVVGGEHQRVGTRLRITAWLLNVPEAAIVRTAKVDGERRDLFTLQDRLVSELMATSDQPEAQPESIGSAPLVPSTLRTTGSGLSARSSIVIDGPPPPVAPETISRDSQGGTTIRAVRLPEALAFDGQLDEAVYDEVISVGGFIQQLPDEGAPATEETEALVFFDEEHVWVSARMWDSAPEDQWVANDMRRDSFQIISNDNLTVVFDTFYDRRNGVAFIINPLGGFFDFEISDESNPNSDWNPVWDVRTGRFDQGWTLEMRVPFKSLKFRPGVSQVWGIQLERRVMRKNETSHIAAVPIAARPGTFRISQGATLVGLEMPARNTRFEVKPYGIGSSSTDLAADQPFSNKGDGDWGVDAKYGLTQNLTADFTYNTDFAQVEVDQQQVNLTRFSLFFPEKREFFLESRGTFDFGRGQRPLGRGGGPTGPEGRAPLAAAAAPLTFRLSSSAGGSGSRRARQFRLSQGDV